MILSIVGFLCITLLSILMLGFVYRLGYTNGVYKAAQLYLKQIMNKKPTYKEALPDEYDFSNFVPPDKKVVN